MAGPVDVELEEVVAVFGRHPDPEREVACPDALVEREEARLLIVGDGPCPGRPSRSAARVHAVVDHRPVRRPSARECARNRPEGIGLEVFVRAAGPVDVVEPDRVVALTDREILDESPLEIEGPAGEAGHRESLPATG